MYPSADEISELLRSMRSCLRWKPGSAERHLRMRIKREHLPAEATIDAYEQIIASVLDDPFAHVYMYQESDTPYLSVTSIVRRQHWLVIAGMDGVLETAFIVEINKLPEQAVICVNGANSGVRVIRAH